MKKLHDRVVTHRLLVIFSWIFIILLAGTFAAPNVADRLNDTFAPAGTDAVEADQRQIAKLGTGAQAPYVLLYSVESGDITEIPEIQASIDAVQGENPGSRVLSYFTTQDEALVNEDRTEMLVHVYPAGVLSFSNVPDLPAMIGALQQTAPDGVTAELTGYAALYFADPETADTSVVADLLIGGLGALVILLVVFGTLPAVLMPLMVAITSILTTFAAVWALTYVVDVSIVVQFLIALVGLGIAIDYSLLVIFRYREELERGQSPAEALETTISRAGRALIISGTTVAISLLSLIILPVDFLRSIAYAGLLIPVISVIVGLTLLPAVISLLGERINSIPLLPRRLTKDGGDTGWWARWARLVTRRPVPVFIVGLALTMALVIPGINMNPANPEATQIPGKGPTFDGRDEVLAAGFAPGVFRPVDLVFEGPDFREAAQRGAAAAADVEGVEDVVVSTEEGWVGDEIQTVPVLLEDDAATFEADATMDRLDEVLPDAIDGFDASVTVAGQSVEDWEFFDSVYSNAWLIITFVVLLTYVLLARATRSLVMPLKAVILNVLSIFAAYGAMVIIFQWGYGSEFLFDIQATESITQWIPLMVFAFLFGISMDYEVFLLTRMREAYDQTGNTSASIALGLQRTGKLITSGALILFFAFVVLSTGPGVDLKQFAVGLAAGILFDATIIRVLLVPSVMKMLGDANWWFPEWAAKLLRVDTSKPIEAH